MDAVRPVNEPGNYAVNFGDRLFPDRDASRHCEKDVRSGSNAPQAASYRFLSSEKQEGANRIFEETVLMGDFIRDMWDFMKVRKKFWMAPIILIMVLLGGLLVLAQGSAVAPFIYTLF